MPGGQFQLVGRRKTAPPPSGQTGKLRLRASGSSSADPSKPETQSHRLYSSFGFRDKKTYLAGMAVPFEENEPPLARVNKVMGPVAALATSLFCKKKETTMHPYCLAIATDCGGSASAKKGRSVRLVLRLSDERYTEDAPVAAQLPAIGTAAYDGLIDRAGDRSLHCKCVVVAPKDAAKAQPGDVIVAELSLDLPGANQKDIADLCQPGSAAGGLKNPVKLTLAERLDTVSLELTFEDKPPVAAAKNGALYDRTVLLTATPHYRPHGGIEKKVVPKKGETLDGALAKCEELVRSNLARTTLIDGPAVELLKTKVGIAKSAASSPAFLEVQLLASGTPQLCVFGSGTPAPALRGWPASETLPMPYQVRVEYGPSARIRLGDRISCPAGGIVIRAASASNIIRGQYGVVGEKKGNGSGPPVPVAHPDAAYMIIADSGHSTAAAGSGGSACVLLASGSHEVGGGKCPFFPPATLAENVFDKAALAPCPVVTEPEPEVGIAAALHRLPWPLGKSTWPFAKKTETLEEPPSSGLEGPDEEAEHAVVDVVDSTESLAEALDSLVFPDDTCDQLREQPPVLSFDYETGENSVERRFVVSASGDDTSFTHAGVVASQKACGEEKGWTIGERLLITTRRQDVFNDSTEFNTAIGKSPFSNFTMAAPAEQAPSEQSPPEQAPPEQAPSEQADAQLAPAVLAFEATGLVLRRDDDVMRTKEVQTSITFYTGGTLILAGDDEGSYDGETEVTATVDSIEHGSRGCGWEAVCLASGESANDIMNNVTKNNKLKEAAKKRKEAATKPPESLAASSNTSQTQNTATDAASSNTSQTQNTTIDITPKDDTTKDDTTKDDTPKAWKPWEQYVFLVSPDDSKWRYHYLPPVLFFGLAGHFLLRRVLHR